MLGASGLSKFFWGEAITTTAYLVNRSPSTTIELKTPEEKWNGKPPDLKHLRVFGYSAFAYQKEGKLDSLSIKCVFLGYGDGVKGYRLWSLEPKGSRLIISQDVVFNEDEFLKLKKGSMTLVKRFKIVAMSKLCSHLLEIELSWNNNLLTLRGNNNRHLNLWWLILQVIQVREKLQMREVLEWIKAKEISKTINFVEIEFKERLDH